MTSGIEWTDETWNPVAGCSAISPGCKHCYAARIAARLAAMGGGTGARYAGLTQPAKAGPVWTGSVRLNETALDKPRRWRRPRRIFVNSMSDLFHKDIPRAFIDRVFDVMERADRYVYQVLTKRSSPMRNYVRARYAGGPVPRHIWIGVSVEDAAHIGRIGHLKRVDSEARFVSFEPLLGSVDEVDLRGIAWARVRPRCATHASRVGATALPSSSNNGVDATRKGPAALSTAANGTNTPAKRQEKP